MTFDRLVVSPAAEGELEFRIYSDSTEGLYLAVIISRDQSNQLVQLIMDIQTAIQLNQSSRDEDD